MKYASRSATCRRSSTSSTALADRALLQVDQAASQDQALLWYLGQRGPDPAPDRHLGLRARGHRPQATRDRARSLHFATDPERPPIRESPSRTSTCGTGLHSRRYPLSQPVAALRLLTGHYCSCPYSRERRGKGVFGSLRGEDLECRILLALGAER